MKYSLKLGFLVLIISLFAVSACDDETSTPTATVDISGIINDSSGAPLADALVDALDSEDVILASDSTDSEGKFKLAELPESLNGIDIRIQKDGYQTHRGAISEFIGEGGDNTLQYQMLKDGEKQDSCCNGSLIVIPKDSADGSALSSGYAKLWQADKLIAKATIVNNKASFSNVCEGTYLLAVYSEGYKTYEEEYSHSCNDSLVKEIQMVKSQEDDDCCGVVEICVTDNDGNPIDDVDIRLYKGEKKIALKYTDGKNPCVKFEDLCEGDYWFRVYHADYQVIEKEFELGKCDTLKFEKKLQAKEEQDTCNTASLKVKVKDKEAYEYIGGIKVLLKMNGSVIKEGKTNKSGYIIFNNLKAPAEYKAYVPETDKYNSGYFTVGFEKCTEKQETLWLQPKKSDQDSCCKGILYVMAKDKETGEKIKEGKIKLWKDGQLIETAYMKDGVAVIDGICEGQYGVDVYGNGYKTMEFVYEHDCNKEVEYIKQLEKVK